MKRMIISQYPMHAAPQSTHYKGNRGRAQRGGPEKSSTIILHGAASFHNAIRVCNPDALPFASKLLSLCGALTQRQVSATSEGATRNDTNPVLWISWNADDDSRFGGTPFAMKSFAKWTGRRIYENFYRRVSCARCRDTISREHQDGVVRLDPDHQKAVHR
jgi:hypothetical protein